MSAHMPLAQLRAVAAGAIFPALSLADFAASYPEGAHKLRHELRDHPLFERETLAALAEVLPAGSVECRHSDLPAGEAIRSIEAGGGVVALNDIAQVPAYAALLADLLGELEHLILTRTGRMIEDRSAVFISGPGAVTPYHFDPEHTILLQLAGEKAMTVFPAGDPQFAPDRMHETCHAGGGCELAWHDAFGQSGVEFKLTPGDTVYVPAMAPHYVRTGSGVSISLTIGWRSEWSFAEADARAFNRLLRRLGLDPEPPGRWPERNTAKAIAWRVARWIPGIID